MKRDHKKRAEAEGELNKIEGELKAKLLELKSINEYTSDLLVYFLLLNDFSNFDNIYMY